MERDDVISLEDYLAVVRRQARLIVLTTVIVVVSGVAVSFAQTPLYEGEADVVVEPVRRTQDVSLEDLLAPSGTAVETERRIMQSRAVVERAAEALGTSDLRALNEEVRVEAVRETRIVQVIATDPDPARAADIANAYTQAYLDYRRDQAVDELLAARASLEDRAAELQDRIEQIDANGTTDTGEGVEREALIAQLAQVSAQIAELGDAAEAVSGGGQVLTPAEPATSPVSPRPLRTGALAVVLGLLLGIGLAFLRDHLDDVVRDEADFKRATSGRPILGRIPAWEDPSENERLVTLVAPSSVTSEAYRELSAGVRFLLLASQEGSEDETAMGRSVMVSSAIAGEGKTSVACNLAIAAARVGLRTVLVDADLRRAAVRKRIGMGRATGVSDVLLSGGKPTEHLVDIGVENLRVLTAGTIPPNPNELLASTAMGALHRELAAGADLVIYDTPAALAVPDALELGRYVDLTVLVGRQGASGRRQLAAVIERFDQTGTKVDGTVLNCIDSRSAGYYYTYQYVDEAVEPADIYRPKRRRSGRHKHARKRSGATTAPASRASEHEEAKDTDAQVDEHATEPAAPDHTIEVWDSFFTRSEDETVGRGERRDPSDSGSASAKGERS